MDRALGTYTFQYTLHTNPAAITTTSQSNPTNGWTTIAPMLYLSAQPGFAPYLRHRFDFTATNGRPILATGVRIRLAATNTIDELEINPPAAAGSDAVFGLELTAQDILPAPPKLVFNEVSAASSNTFWLEVINDGDSVLSLGGVDIVRGATSFMFSEQSLAPGGIVALTQAQLGFGAEDGDKLFLRGSGGFSLLDTITVKVTPRGAASGWRGRLDVPGAANTRHVERGRAAQRHRD